MKTTETHFNTACLIEPPVSSNNGNKKGNYLLKNVIEIDYLEKVCRGDETSKINMLNELRADISLKLAEMEDALAEKNYEAINTIAHEMKTTVFILGLLQLIGGTLQKIEKLSLSHCDIGEIKAIFADVKMVCERALIEAKQMVD